MERGIMSRTNTVIFEEKYGVDIDRFSNTHEIDDFIAKREGKKSLEVVLFGVDIVSTRGDVFPLLDIDINKSFEKAIKK